jgi:thiol:disulfide interchange protein DsbC
VEKSKIVGSILCILIAIVSITACAEKKVLSPEESLRIDFPKTEAKSVVPGPIEGLYEVRSGPNIMYYSPKSSSLFVGEIFTKTGENLTAKSRELLIKEFIKELPLDKAIKIGNGKNTVIMWTDPDCPYCRKIEEYFKDKKDITRYVYLLPLEQLHPKATAKSENILCQTDENKDKVFFETMSGAFDKSDLAPCVDVKVKNALSENKAIAQKMGIRGTPFLVLNGTIIRGADMKALDKLLAEGTK